MPIIGLSDIRSIPYVSSANTNSSSANTNSVTVRDVCRNYVLSKGGRPTSSVRLQLEELFAELEDLKGEMFQKYYETDLDLTGKLAAIIKKYKERIEV